MNVQVQDEHIPRIFLTIFNILIKCTLIKKERVLDRVKTLVTASKSQDSKKDIGRVKMFSS